MTISVSSVAKNTKVELVDSDIISMVDLDELLVKIYDCNGIDGLKDFENAVTILDETGNINGLHDFICDMTDQYL